MARFRLGSRNDTYIYIYIHITDALFILDGVASFRLFETNVSVLPLPVFFKDDRFPYY